jgi:hypothetical protein
LKAVTLRTAPSQIGERPDRIIWIFIRIFERYNCGIWLIANDACVSCARKTRYHDPAVAANGGRASEGANKPRARGPRACADAGSEIAGIIKADNALQMKVNDEMK